MKQHWIINATIVFGTTLLGGMLPAAYALQPTAPPEASKPIIQWVVTLFMGGFCVLVLFKNAKRTNKD